MTAIAGMDVREKAHLFPPGADENWCSNCKSQCGGSAKTEKNGSTTRFSYKILGYISYSKDTHSSVFMAVLLTNPRKLKYLRCLLTDEWLIKIYNT